MKALLFAGALFLSSLCALCCLAVSVLCLVFFLGWLF